MADQEQANALSHYGVMQKAVRALAAVCFILLIFNLGVLLGGFPVPELEIVFAILGLVLGLAALGLSAAMMGLRRKVTAALADGTVIEVRAPAFQNRTMGSKANSWNVGPLSIMTSPELQPLLVEGAQASVVCIPGIKVALSVNGTAFKRPPMLSAPPNLAAMAAAEASGPAPALQPGAGASVPHSVVQGLEDVSKYPDLTAELLKAKAWLLSNLKNRKKNLPRFVNNWLSREQERARRVEVNTPEPMKKKDTSCSWVGCSRMGTTSHNGRWYCSPHCRQVEEEESLREGRTF